MKHPTSTIRLTTNIGSGDITILAEKVRTWKRYHEVLRRFRELMKESPRSLNIEVGA